MEYARLGDSGLIVSRLAFGARTLGVREYGGVPAMSEQADADRLVACALDLGVNLFDAADGYGDGSGSEEILGAALRNSGGRDRAIISIKVTPMPDPDPGDNGMSSYRQVIAYAEAALRRLGTDRIDLYRLDLHDFSTPLDELLGALHDLVRRGLVRYVGWSNFPAWYAARARGLQEREDAARFVFAQIYLSLVGRDAEHEILPYCRSDGLGTLIWKPLAGGFLAGELGRNGETGRSSAGAFPATDPERDFLVVDRLHQIASENGATPAQAAYAWLLARPGVTSLIVEASKPERLEEHLRAAELVLPKEHVAELEEMTRPPKRYPAMLLPHQPEVDRDAQ